jgi:SPP1 family predicted phage head-tail adaptor
MRKTTGIQAGPLRHRVTIQTPVVQTADTGEAIVTEWLDLCEVWAAIETLSGREWLASAEFRPGVTTRIRIRWRADVGADMRVLHGSTVFGIDAVLPQWQGMSELHLMCTDGIVTDGGQP